MDNLVNTKGISLHIGLNEVSPKHYVDENGEGWVGKLNGCENDANDMQDIAKNLKFNTQLLLTKNATREAVISRINEAAEKLKSGDFFFLSYSGHGGTLPDYNNDELDSQDETWCLYDGELIDDETYTLLSKFDSGVRIFVLSDSCHSGTVVRQKISDESPINNGKNYVPSLPYKELPFDVAIATYANNKDFYKGLLENSKVSKSKIDGDNIQASVILISGCQDHQLSLDGSFNGKFTGAVKHAWFNSDHEGDYKDFHEEVVSKIPLAFNQTPNYFTLGNNISKFEKQKVLVI